MIYAASKDSFRKELEGEALYVARRIGSSRCLGRSGQGWFPSASGRGVGVSVQKSPSRAPRSPPPSWRQEGTHVPLGNDGGEGCVLVRYPFRDSGDGRVRD
jgi:hypothetical protein